MSINEITARDTMSSLAVVAILYFVFGFIIEAVIFGLSMWLLLLLIQKLDQIVDRFFKKNQGHIDD
ncbi:MAG: hypothetical protein COA54_02340 [Thiotrichaceae bacterium]|nr:MAG: hypothetical protein COA54_02340 [Thiotrichaceae bacterium]